MNAILNIIIILPYITQSVMISPSAPSHIATGRMIKQAMSEIMAPTMAVPATIIVKYSLALSFFFSPRVIATSALPPVPNMKPTPPNIIRNGIIRLMAAKASLPTKLETNRPSTTQYIDVNTIITIDGNTKRRSLLYVKWSDNWIFMVLTPF